MLKSIATFRPFVICIALVLLNKSTQVLSSVLPKDLNELIETRDGNHGESVSLGDVDKRKNWQGLHGAWGKRLFNSNEAELSGYSEESSLESQPEAWLHLTMPVDTIDHKNNDKISLIYMSNDKTPSDEFESIPMQYNDGNLDFNLDNNDRLLAFKRNWKNMNVAWGKRRQQPTWNKFRGAWGKREPSWNNLKGMWGKRANKQWEKLHNAWGKRDQQVSGLDDNSK